MTETTWVSFQTLATCLTLKTLSLFPVNVGFLSLLTLGGLVLFPQLRFGLCRFKLSSSDFRTVPWSRRSLGRRHSAKVHWTSLRVLVPLHKPRLHGNTHRSCKQFVSLVRIGRIFEHAALRQLLFFLKGTCLSRSLFQCRRNHRIERIEVRETSSRHNRSWCQKFINWCYNLNSFGPLHCEMRICWCWTYFSFEVDFPAWKFHRVRQFSQMQFRNRKSRIINPTSTLEAWHGYRRMSRLISLSGFCVRSRIGQAARHSTQWAEGQGFNQVLSKVADDAEGRDRE